MKIFCLMNIIIIIIKQIFVDYYFFDYFKVYFEVFLCNNDENNILLKSYLYQIFII